MGNYVFVITLLIFFCNCFLITSRKISIPNKMPSNKINECQRCRVLTESFHYWLDKTSRNKFDGGDAAWEETKLKSYARSEVRLVEIQEGLCSELKKHQDHCYTLSEEAEHPLEKWWFQESTNGGDLYTWLCIDQLQYCCPQSHFGLLCDPCPQNKDNKLCSGHGKCDGDGTRSGKGTCECNKGYTGSLCEQCALSFYQGSNSHCEPCHRACESCTGKGSNSCISCNSGWTHVDSECVDVNECIDLSTCNNNEFCINTKGSYSCKLCDDTCNTCTGAGSDNCTSCKPDSMLWNGMCINDEMKTTFFKFALQRISLYVGLLLISFFVYRKSKTLASIVIAIVAIYIFFSESTSKITSFDIFLNIAFK